jgi:hypothetical protein
MAEVEVGVGDACAVVEDESDACEGGTGTDEEGEDSDAGARDASAASLRRSFLSCRF